MTAPRPILWSPQAGPQERFLRDPHFETLFGGAAGGGKTEALIHDGLHGVDNPYHKALFLRRTFPELQEVMDRTQLEFKQLGADWRASEKRWVFPSGAIYQFGYCKDYQDVLQYQGQEFSWLGFDEGGNIPEERIWLFLLSRLRSKDASLRVFARVTANPGGAGHGWLKKRFVSITGHGKRPYRDPLTGLTRNFIPSRVTDNPILMQSNPLYVAQLQQLPEQLRRQMLDGDWDAGAGLALSELDERIHFVEPFEIPQHWYRFGGFDWGYSHPWWCAAMAQDEEGFVYVTNTCRGRHQLPDDIAARILDMLGSSRLSAIAAGHDCWHQIKARGESGPTIAERLMAAGLPLVRATISRKTGYQNLLYYARRLDHEGGPVTPKLRFFDTPGNRALFSQLQGIVHDEDDPEDTLKVDADEGGEGGDDGYDALRYGMMLRPYTGAAPKASTPVNPLQALAVDPLVTFEWGMDLDTSFSSGGQLL